MNPKPKRPITVWISQGFLILYGALWPIPFGYWVFLQLFGARFPSLPVGNPLSAYFVFVGIGYLVSAWGVIRRHNWGRWAAVGTALFLIAGMTFLPYLDEGGTWRPSLSELPIAILVMVIISLPSTFPAGLLFLGKRVNSFFKTANPKVDAVVSAEPPPPPIFES